MRRFIVILIAFLFASESSFAQLASPLDDFLPDIEFETPLEEAQLYEVFQGKTHRGTYNFLAREFKTYAFEEETAKDGSIVHIQEHQVDTGQWTITGNVICYDYDDPAISTGCFKIYSRGNCYYHYNVSNNGRPAFGFSARSVIKGERPNCEPNLV